MGYWFLVARFRGLKRPVKYLQQRGHLKRYMGKLLSVSCVINPSILFYHLNIQYFAPSALFNLKFYSAAARFKSRSFVDSIPNQRFSLFLESNVLLPEKTNNCWVNCLKIPWVITNYNYGVFLVSHWNCTFQSIPHGLKMAGGRAVNTLEINWPFSCKIKPNMYSELRQLPCCDKQSESKLGEYTPSRSLLCWISLCLVHCNITDKDNKNYNKCCICPKN